MGLRVVIPVAGAGTRMRPHTHTTPKVLIPVAGKPMLAHILDELRAYDVEEVTLIVGHLGDPIRKYVQGAFPYKFRFVEQPEMKGLGHAIWLSAPGYRETGGPLLIILGDTLFEADFASILRSKENWIGVKSVEDPRRFGVVVLDDLGSIKAMVEKPEVPPSKLAVVGIYYFADCSLLYQCLDEVIEKKITTKGEFQLTDALDGMLRRGAAMRPFEIQSWLDCGKPETHIETNRLLLDIYARRGTLPPAPAAGAGAVVIPPVTAGPGCRIENSVVGPHVTLGAGVVIRDSIVRESVVGDKTEISGLVLTDTIIGARAKLAGKPSVLSLGDDCEANPG